MDNISVDLITEFIREAIWHGSLDAAEAMLAKHPQLAESSIHTAAILADHDCVSAFIKLDANNATTIAQPYGGNALVYLAMSKYLSFGKRPEADFIKTAEILLDAGAEPNSGFWTEGQYPEFETALYGAAGVAHNAALTRLLLARGADPNDNEAAYHSPETWDNDAMMALVQTGRMTENNLTMMLLRKHDFHDYDGAKFLLDHGINPNLEWHSGVYPFHHALKRNNSLQIIKLLLDYGADPNLHDGHITATTRAAIEGRGDVLELLRQRYIPLNLEGLGSLIAACALDDTAQIQDILVTNPQLADEAKAWGGTLLAKFAGNGNAAGVKQLLDLGIAVNTPFAEGDGYFEIPKDSLAIHVAAWRGYPEVVKVLLANGGAVDQLDILGNTPLMLAVKACVNSYWTIRKSPDSVKALLAAGASAERVPFPSGYDEVDKLLR